MVRMVSLKVPLDSERLAAFCRKWHIVEFSAFGSALRDDFGPHSDFDCLVTFDPHKQPSLDDWPVLEAELESMVGRRVDIVERRLVEQSENYIRRRAILASAERLYAAG